MTYKDDDYNSGSDSSRWLTNILFASWAGSFLRAEFGARKNPERLPESYYT